MEGDGAIVASREGISIDHASWVSLTFGTRKLLSNGLLSCAARNSAGECGDHMVQVEMRSKISWPRNI